MALKLITAPSTLPVTLADVKTSLRIDAAELDNELTGVIFGALKIAEHECGRCIMAQTYELTLDAFPSAIELTRTPVASVSSITYADSTGAQTVLSPALYALDDADDYGFSYVVPAFDSSWPNVRSEINAVKVRYVSGYATTAAEVRLDDALKIKIILAQWDKDPTSLYARLESVSKVYA